MIRWPLVRHDDSQEERLFGGAVSNSVTCVAGFEVFPTVNSTKPSSSLANNIVTIKRLIIYNAPLRTSSTPRCSSACLISLLLLQHIYHFDDVVESVFSLYKCPKIRYILIQNQEARPWNQLILKRKRSLETHWLHTLTLGPCLKCPSPKPKPNQRPNPSPYRTK